MVKGEKYKHLFYYGFQGTQIVVRAANVTELVELGSSCSQLLMKLWDWATVICGYWNYEVEHWWETYNGWIKLTKSEPTDYLNIIERETTRCHVPQCNATGNTHGLWNILAQKLTLNVIKPLDLTSWNGKKHGGHRNRSKHQVNMSSRTKGMGNFTNYLVSSINN